MAMWSTLYHIFFSKTEGSLYTLARWEVCTLLLFASYYWFYHAMGLGTLATWFIAFHKIIFAWDLLIWNSLVLHIRSRRCIRAWWPILEASELHFLKIILTKELKPFRFSQIFRCVKSLNSGKSDISQEVPAWNTLMRNFCNGVPRLARFCLLGNISINSLRFKAVKCPAAILSTLQWRCM